MSLAGNLLITGPPGIGKSTLIRSVCDAVGDRQIAGFWTRELRHNGERTGFELLGLGGQRAILAHVDVKGPFRVGKYGVDVRAFERFLERTPFLEPDIELVVIDEIGKMECSSALFRDMAQAALASDKTVIATVASRGGEASSRR